MIDSKISAVEDGSSSHEISAVEDGSSSHGLDLNCPDSML
jgi:hypothetical protein